MQEKITLQLALPQEYPTGASPVVTFTAPGLSKANHHALQANLNDFLSSQSSSTEERLLEIVQFFIEHIPSQSSPIPAVETSEATQSAPDNTNCIVLIWFHHLLSTTKRKAILAQQSLRGISKPGFPGILVLQGPKDIVEDAITELKGMRWQAMQVRGEIEDHEKQLNEGIHEVETVADVVEQMEVLGLGKWCLSALRMT